MCAELYRVVQHVCVCVCVVSEKKKMCIWSFFEKSSGTEKKKDRDRKKNRERERDNLMWLCKVIYLNELTPLGHCVCVGQSVKTCSIFLIFELEIHLKNVFKNEETFSACFKSFSSCVYVCCSFINSVGYVVWSSRLYKKSSRTQWFQNGKFCLLCLGFVEKKHTRDSNCWK